LVDRAILGGALCFARLADPISARPTYSAGLACRMQPGSDTIPSGSRPPSFARRGSPRGASVMPAVTPVDQTPLPIGVHRVLIVDDQPEVRQVCRFALSQEGLAVTEVGTGPDALREAGTQPYDLVLLDVDLPGLTGEEVLRELRRHPPAPFLKVILLS